MADDPRPEITRLIQLAREAAERTSDLAGELSGMIKAVVNADTDPYVIMGILIEGAVHTLAARIPPECQKDTAHALVQMLQDRVRENGLL
jgi:hypothetical protein